MMRDWMAEMAKVRSTSKAVWDIGQTTVEYALVILAAAGVALILLSWVSGGGSLDKLFDNILKEVFEKVSGAGG